MAYRDPRGPERTILAVEYGPCEHLDHEGSFNKLTLDCGHINCHSGHFWYEVGKQVRCYSCGKENEK